MPETRIEYLRVRDLVPNERNPKAHDIAGLTGAIDDLGFIEPIVRDDRTGKLISGHGRTETLSLMESRSAKVPDQVTVDADGYWTVPVAVGWSSRDDAAADAALIGLNRFGERGGYHDERLLAMLTELNETDRGLASSGFDESDLVAMLARADTDLRGGGSHPDSTEYSQKITAPQYQITGDRPDPADLVDRSRVSELADQIRSADLPGDVETFLLAAATRHYVFRYDRIAEFYAHAAAPVQRLMEDSALVIIDFDDAVRNGYVRLSTRLAALLDVELKERDARVLDFIDPAADPEDIAL